MAVALFLLAWLAAAAAPTEVDVALVIAVDVSESMDRGELAVQRAGYVAAFTHPELLRAVRAGRTGRIAVTYVEWAATVRRGTVVPWQVIDGDAAAERFAAAIAAHPSGSFRGTSISAALAYGAEALDSSGLAAARRVIDVSGDGPNNIGGLVTRARDAVVAGGIIVNGLPILIRPSPSYPPMDAYYAACVIGGPGAFVMPVRRVSELAEAIRRKLVMEVSGLPAAGAIVQAASGPAVDCLAGEKLRRALTDRFYPGLDR